MQSSRTNGGFTIGVMGNTASSPLMKQWSKTTCKFEELWMGMDGGKPVVPNVLAIRSDL
jgi:hypothetical protein